MCAVLGIMLKGNLSFLLQKRYIIFSFRNHRTSIAEYFVYTNMKLGMQLQMKL